MATILIADDRPLNREYLVTLLGYYGHRVLEASDGLEALQLVQSDRPDLVISDLVMPIIDGQELASRLHADPEFTGIPVLLFSAAYSLQQAHAVARQVGAIDVLPKPSDPEVILEMVNSALGIAPNSVPAGQEFSPPSGPREFQAFPRELADLEAVSQRLAALVEMSLELTAERDPERLLNGLARMARQLIGAKYSAVGLKNGGGAIRVFRSSGAGDPAVPASNDRNPGAATPDCATSPPENSILARLMGGFQPVRLRAVDRGQLGAEISSASGDAALRSFLGVPFPLQAGMRGWLALADKMGADEFTEEDARVASTLASQGILAFERLQDRLLAEEKTRQSRVMFERLFESAPDAMLATDVQGRIMHINSQTEGMFGYPRNELIGKTIELLIPEPVRAVHSGLRENYHRAPHLRSMGAGMDLLGRRRDASEFPVDVMLSPMEAEEGTLVLSVIRDITRRKQNEERIMELNRQLQARVEELQTANQSLETFSYSVSHDLRTPLRAIEGFARILSEDYGSRLDDEAQRLLDVIACNCQKMGRLTGDLLDFSRVNKAGIQKGQVDMTAVAESVVEELRASDTSRQVEVKLHSMPEALADRKLIRQVFANLIGNAWKFTRRESHASIEIGSCPNEQTPVYFVRDNGVGFEPEYSHKLFCVFERLHTDRDFDGTGIGLATVRRIVQHHGGEAWAIGKAGAGATFFFTLAPPRARKDGEASCSQS